MRGRGTVVACVDLTGSGPAILLSGHLEGEVPILIYRAADYRSTLGALRAAGGQRFAVYQLVRPEAANHFDGRIDEP
ncbi:MAG: hypothetical protein M3203_00725 [Actinomycetota bacterium]|nr:hypothetical protein [Actinomycetota bacterium]